MVPFSIVEVCVSRFSNGHLAAPSPLDPSLRIFTKSESAQQAYLNKYISTSYIWQ